MTSTDEDEYVNGDIELIDAISEHVEEHIKKFKSVIHDNDSKFVHIDILVVEPTERRDYFTIVTCGMSQKRMEKNPSCNDCEHESVCGYCELVLCLPSWWPVPHNGEYIHCDVREHWPFSVLFKLAYYPHRYGARLCAGHSVCGEDSNPNVPFPAYLLSHPRLLPEEFQSLNYDGRLINFYAVFPLFEDELEYKRKHGSQELDVLFDIAGVTELLDETRKSVL